jgi:hypothetical protein
MYPILDAGKEHNAEKLLKPRDLTADRTLGHVQLFRSP